MITLCFFISFHSEVYTDGAGICNMLWGNSFFYSDYSSTDPDSERQCLIPYFPANQANPNDAAIANLFADESTTESDSGCVPTVGWSRGYTFVLLVFLVLLLML